VLYVLIYVCIGMVYAGATLPSDVKKMMEKEDNPFGELTPLVGIAVGAIVVAPFWPMFITMSIVKALTNRRTSTSMDE
jgi:uncharacterized membrane protein YdjX (TVP38/TMEM64 family)